MRAAGGSGAVGGNVCVAAELGAIDRQPGLTMCCLKGSRIGCPNGDELHKAECAGLPFWKGTRLPHLKLAIGAGLARVSQRRAKRNGGKKDTGQNDVQKETSYFFFLQRQKNENI